LSFATNAVRTDGTLAEVDPEVAAILSDEESRQRSTLALIASENYASVAVRQASGSILTNKYSEGYPGKRYYAGNEWVDAAEALAISGLRSYSEPSTPTCNRTRARNRTWRPISRP